MSADNEESIAPRNLSQSSQGSGSARGEAQGAEDTAESYYASVTGVRAEAWSEDLLATRRAAAGELKRQQVAFVPAEGATRPDHPAKDFRLPELDPEARAQVFGGSELGYQLLRKAGWRGSGGLGAREQGIASPVAAWQQSGRRGIGSQQLRAEAAKRLPNDQVAAGTAGEHLPAPGNAARGEEEAEQGQTVRSGVRSERAPKRGWERVSVEEPLDIKVQRWRQVLQAEEDDRAGKAIDRYMYRAFRDEDTDTNPLLRRNNLSASNPLL